MKRIAVVLLGTVVLALLSAVPCLAATPQEIYGDYAASCTLCGPYTVQELEAYLNDATIHQYGNPAVVRPLDTLVEKLAYYINQGRTFEEASKLAQGERPVYPFTGFELLLAGLGGIALVGIGAGFRRSKSS